MAEGCIVRGERGRLSAGKIEAVVTGLNAFLDENSFLNGVSPSQVEEAHRLMVIAAGCAWPPKSGTPAWHWRRATLLTQKNYTCEYCGRTAGPSGTRGHALRMEVDHIRAKSRFENDRGAAEEWSNLTVACRSCNVVKGQADVDVFKSELIDLAQAVMRLSSD